MLKPVSQKAQPKGPRAEIIAQAAAFWGELCGNLLSDEDGREIMRNLTGFFDVLSGWEAAECGRPTCSVEVDGSKSATTGRGMK